MHACHSDVCMRVCVRGEQISTAVIFDLDLFGMLVHLVHTHTFNGLYPGLQGWAGTRKVKLIWI